MLQIESSTQSIFQTVAFQVETPEGSMFVTIIESDDHKPIGIDIHVGKAGSTVKAWATSLARILTMALDHGATLNDIMVELSGQRSDRPSRTTLVNISSGPEGIAYALMLYKRDRSGYMRAQAGIGDDTETERTGRGPRLAR